MKIIQFSAENIKRLRAVEITPKGEIVTVAGRNGQGKTSVLDSIWWAVAGAKHIQAQPVRKGETKARIVLSIGTGEKVELIVERRFTKGNDSTLHVSRPDGSRFPKPQEILNDLIGALCFDPLAFMRMPGKDQIDELRRIAKVDLDFDKLDGLNASDYERRTDLNRAAKMKRAQAEAVTIPEGLPAEPIDTTPLMDAIQNAATLNSSIERMKVKRDHRAREITAKEQDAVGKYQRAAELRAQAAKLQADAEQVEKEAAEDRAALADSPALPEPIDVAELRAGVDVANVVNRGFEVKARRTAIESEAAELEAQAQVLTENIDARAAAKAEAIAAAKMPVPGLGFGEGVVTYQGVPFDQSSSAEQIRVSMAIAMAANPKLRVLRIQDGSLLDEQSLAIVEHMAKDQDFQVWVERVQTDGQVGVVIEDGSVISVDGKAVQAKQAA